MRRRAEDAFVVDRTTHQATGALVASLGWLRVKAHYRAAFERSYVRGWDA